MLGKNHHKTKQKMKNQYTNKNRFFIFSPIIPCLF